MLLPSPLTWFHLPLTVLSGGFCCFPGMHLPLTSFFFTLAFHDSSDLCLPSLTNCLPFLVFHHLLFLCSVFPPPARRAHRYRRHHHKGRRERRKHKRHGHREGGHHGGEPGQGHNHAHFWTKKQPILFPFLSFCQLQSACFPAVPSSRPNSPKHYFTTLNSQPKLPPPLSLSLHCPALSSTPGSLESACIIVNCDACQIAARRHQDNNNPFVLFLLSRLTCLFLIRPLTRPSYSPAKLNDDLKYGATLTCFWRKRKKNIWDPHRTFFGPKWFSTNCK